MRLILKFMQISKRKSDKINPTTTDPYLTAEKIKILEMELDKLIKFVRPRLSNEVAEHAKLGDFSENAAYQIAKGKLRGINHRMLEIEEILRTAIIIPACNDGNCVQIGSQVTIETNGAQKTYQILGSQETDPGSGRISHLSPIGAALNGHHENDEIEIEINDRKIKYKIISIN